jgi:surface antigen
MAQGYDRGGYGSDRAYDQYNDSNPPSTNQDNNYPDPKRDRYERDRDNYERDRQRYEEDQRATPRWDREAYYRDCERQRGGNTAGGAIAGALVGGLIGNSVSRGDRGAGTAVGAILGGVAGASIASNLSCEDRSYAIDAEFRGFEGGRSHQRYDWRSPRGGAYGYVQVGDYYRDGGRRCATYSEEVWVGGRPETIRGRACRQPDGRWQTIS